MWFEWDEDKAHENEKKHRVSFEHAQHVFDDPRAVPFEDLQHSRSEEIRHVMIGMSPIGLLFYFIYISRRSCTGFTGACGGRGISRR